MGRRAFAAIAIQTTSTFIGAGTTYIVQATNGALYCVYVDQNADVVFAKSTDGGLTWTTPVVVFAGTTANLSIWYDRWSDVAGDLIHCAYTESGGHDTLYRTIDTASSDGLSTQTTIFAGSSAANGGHLSIVRAKGGNVYCKTVIDAGAEGGFYRLPTANVPDGAWDAARTVDETIATTDQMILLPDLTAADTQDIMAVFWDASADEISRKLYDDSGNSWAETSIAGTMVDTAATVTFPHFAAAMDITNSRAVLVAWSAVDAANADLRCWTVTNSAITEVTPVVSNGTDDQGLAAIGIDTVTGFWWVAYGGKSDGSETWNTAANLYCKVSQDAGTTWGAETLLTQTAQWHFYLAAAPRFTGPFAVLANVRHAAGINILTIGVDRTVPRATYQLGV